MRMLLMVLALCAGMACPVFANEVDEVLQGRLESLSLTDADRQAKELLDQDISLKKIVQDILSGELSLDLSGIFGYIGEKVFGELHSQVGMVRNLILIVLLSAVLKNLNASFAKKAVGELGFYVCYMVLIVLVATEFYYQVNMVSRTVHGITMSFQAMLPAFFALGAASGQYAQLAVIGPTVMAGSGLLSTVLSVGVLPVITLAASLEFVNQITEKPMLGRFTTLLREGIQWGMKGVAFLFMLLLSLQKIGGGAIGRMAGKTAKAAVEAIPVIGDIMGSAVDTTAAVTGLLRSGVLVGAVVFLIVLCAVPLLKLLAMIILYKLTAAAAEPICEGRLVKCIGAVGDFCVLLFGVLFLAEAMLIFCTVLLLAVF